MIESILLIDVTDMLIFFKFVFLQYVRFIRLNLVIIAFPLQGTQSKGLGSGTEELLEFSFSELGDTNKPLTKLGINSKTF